MKQIKYIIKLTKNIHTIVDPDDYEWLNQYKWTAKESNGGKIYAVRRNPKSRKHIYMHKQIMGFPELEVDHINGESLDNRKSNLRICTHAENLRNQKLSIKNTSGYKGVSFNKKCNKWEAYIKINQKKKFLGLFTDIEDAILTRKITEKILFGEFIRDLEI